MKEKKRGKIKINLLECTLRDGSYAVDFRFTKDDTAMLCRALSGLGFKYIEIGHGLGINASVAGKGRMPSSDRELLEVAKINAKEAKIGMFCIPGIATPEALKEMAQAGLDFVRVGANSEEIEQAFPYLEASRKNGLLPMLNFMKSYTISPREFAKKAKAAAGIGAQVIYLVDSAGGMLPEEVKRYIQEAKSKTKLPLGLHAHNNLHLATANALEAIKSGASFIDTTLYGLGRSAGNVPTEVMVALLENRGIDTGIDLFSLMDTAEKYLMPLMNRVQMHDMLSVVMGASKFHSSFFPQVKKTAEEYHVDERRLTFMMGKKSPSSLDQRELKETAKKIRASKKDNFDYDITSFKAPGIGRDYISNTFKSVKNLVEGLIDASAKGRRNIVVEVVPARENDETLVLAEYVISDQDMVMGRVYFGSRQVLQDILALVKDYVSLLLIDTDSKVGWIRTHGIYEICREVLGLERVTFYNSWELKTFFLQEGLIALKNRINTNNLLLSGPDAQINRLISRLSPIFEHIFIHRLSAKQGKEAVALSLPDNCTLLEVPADWKNLNLKIGLALSLAMLAENQLDNICRGMPKDSYFLTASLTQALSWQKETLEPRVVFLDYALAYRGQFCRWMFGLKREIDG